jgi:pimeloyl-ACP methyl ester carboxylesterase
VVGSGSAAFPLELGAPLKDWIETPDLDVYRRVDGREIIAGALDDLERYPLPEHVLEDYLSSYEGDRFVESMRFVRSYPTELPILRHLLADIHTPVQIIAGARDAAVPPINAEYLHERLPNSKLDIVDAGHFTWEDAADEYATLVTDWWRGGPAATGPGPPADRPPPERRCSVWTKESPRYSTAPRSGSSSRWRCSLAYATPPTRTTWSP